MSHPLVLLVDDDADTRELYRMVLESVGYRVEDAARVAAASSALARMVPDVIITDWLLPDGNGLDVCRALHARAATRGVPVVAVSGLSFDSDTEQSARQQGVIALLEKPADPDTILSSIQEALTIGTARRLRAAAERARRYAEFVRRPSRRTNAQGASERAEAEAVLERVAAKSGASVTLMIADDSAHYVAVSGAARELTGYDSSELAALTVWDLSALPKAADCDGLWQQFLASGGQQGQYTLRRRDGQAVEAQYVALANIAPGWHVSAIAEAPHMPASLGDAP